MSVRSRLARLEAMMPTDPFKPWATFLWCSDADNLALKEAEKAAEAAGLNIMVIRLVSPELDANGRVIKRQEQ
jgi:hypothetical protein